MKKLLTNEGGNLLVILVIAMTIIAVLAAGFVDIISSKHEGFSHLVSAQKANMVARAGLEWGIRYISDGLLKNTSEYYKNRPHLQPTSTGMSFGEGTFTVKWTYSISDITSDKIEAAGTVQGVTETIVLSNFRLYLKPITLSPATPITTPWSGELRVPVIGNTSGTNIAVNQLDLTISEAGGLLTRIWIYNETDGMVKIFDYTDDRYDVCNWLALSLPCRWEPYGVLLPPSVVIPITNAKGLSNHEIKYGKESLYIFQFYYYRPSGQYTLAFNSPAVSTLQFTP